MKFYVYILLLCGFCLGSLAWDSEELEIFDLVEEINQNFYEFMNISHEATNNEIKRAFRGLSIVLHPDKNPSEDANIQFRNLVSIYEVLRETSKREKYNKVLREGLPNWKSALYYYRRMRKIGLYEGAGILFVIISIGQYLFAWAAYLEKKYTAEQVFGSKLKKLQKKNKSIDMDVILKEIPSPSILNTLPFQIPLFIWHLPSAIKEALNRANELKEMAMEKRRLELEEVQRQEDLERELEEQARLRKEKKENLRKRRQNTTAPEKTDEELRGYSQIQARELTEDDAVKPVQQKTALSGGFWTDEDLTELIRLVKKYPGGSSARWNIIAETMNRSVQEVTFMAAKMKENGYRLPGQSAEQSSEFTTQEVIKKEKVKKSAAADKNILVPETNWSQEQQRALESAIIKNRKNATGDRWQKIANCVPEKSKEECLLRYKYLCELVKSQKKSEEEAATDNQEENCDQVETIEEELPTSINVAEDNIVEDESVDKVGKKRNKRKERRRRRDMSSDEDSDDAYQYEIN
ncbi:PREDICTED: uncharacterized protein F54F2.9 [Rhagoletis zephyria]|uniref:uncharacterized protein F54F2.9 n=1 Tax=Rhagoletis zephyria TaxID=28612 RepID=UPI0008118782|nr:PREDICTED: uncharacterized protein F54F2.9 [Rhagoletis zephyria]